MTPHANAKLPSDAKMLKALSAEDDSMPPTVPRPFLA